MRYLTITSAIFSVATTLHAENSPCKNKAGNVENCTPIVACIENRSVYFKGRAIGWNKGTLAGNFSTGTICTGNWVSRNAFGLGEANIHCDDGSAAKVFFTYQDSITGTATGAGSTMSGDAIRMWSGHNLSQFLSDRTGEIDSVLLCGEIEIPIS